jgi:hypothetical protein
MVFLTEVKPDWDLPGAIEDARLLFAAGQRISQDDKMAGMEA